MAVQFLLELEALVFSRTVGFRVNCGFLSALEVDLPDTGCVVGRAGCEVAHVWREQDACDVGSVGAVLRDWDQSGHVPNGDQTPYEDGAMHTVADCRA